MHWNQGEKTNLQCSGYTQTHTYIYIWNTNFRLNIKKLMSFQSIGIEIKMHTMSLFTMAIYKYASIHAVVLNIIEQAMRDRERMSEKNVPKNTRPDQKEKGKKQKKYRPSNDIIIIQIPFRIQSTTPFMLFL